MISASNAGSTIACPAREAFPHAKDTSEAADRGNALHEFARVCTVNPAAREAALADVPEEWRVTAKGMNLELALDGLEVIGCERAYALNVKTRTTRFIGTNIGRDYGALEPYEIPFTIDVEARTMGSPVELDYKSGQYIGPVKDHWQRRVCATGLMFFYDAPTAISRVAYIWENGSIHPDGHEFSMIDAEDFCDVLVRAVDAVAAAKAEFAAGRMPTVYPSDDACKYCPAMTSCPYMTNFARSMLSTLKAIETGPDLIALTGEQLGAVWEQLKIAEKIVELQLTALKKIAVESPIPVGELYVVRPKTMSKTSFDAAAARGLITTLLGRTGANDEDIQKQMSTLYRKNEYNEFRKVKKTG